MNQSHESPAPEYPLAAPELALPPMSDSLERLLALSEEEQQHIRMLELLVAKDPVAVARVLAIANSAQYRRAKRITNVSEALMVLGGQASYTLLLSVWATATLAIPRELEFARDFLVRHVFSVVATSRRLALVAGLERKVDCTDLQLFTLVGTVTLGLALTDAAPEKVQNGLKNAARDGFRMLSRMPALQPVLAHAESLGKAWKMPDSVVASLHELAYWQSFEEMPLAVDLLQLAEVVQHGASQRVTLAQLYDLAGNSEVMRLLNARQVNPLTIALRV